MPEPSPPPTDSQAGSPWALGGGSDTSRLWAVPEPSARHRRAIGCNRPSSLRQAERTGGRPDPLWRRPRRRPLDHAREANKENWHRSRRDIVEQCYSLAVADDLWGASGIYAEGGSARVRGGYGGNLGARPHHARNPGRHRFRGLRVARWGRRQSFAVAAPFAALADGGTAAADAPAKTTKGKEKRWQRVAVAAAKAAAAVVVAAAAVVSAAAARVPAAAAVAAKAGHRAWGHLLAPKRSKRTDRGADLAPPMGSRPIRGCTEAAAGVA